MVDKEVDAKIVEEVVFVSMVDENIYAKTAEEVVFVSMVDEEDNAKIVEGRESGYARSSGVGKFE